MAYSTVTPISNVFAHLHKYLQNTKNRTFSWHENTLAMSLPTTIALMMFLTWIFFRLYLDRFKNCKIKLIKNFYAS